MKSLHNTFESIFDVDDNLNKISKDLELQYKLEKSVRPRNAARICKNLVAYLDRVGTKVPSKRFQKSGIEIGIYSVAYGFTLVNWRDDEMWTLYEFYDPESYAYEIPSMDFSDNYNCYAVYEIDKEVQDFLVKLFFS